MIEPGSGQAGIVTPSSPRPGLPHDFRLAQPNHDFRQGVVVGVAPAPNRGFEPGFGQPFGVLDRDVLRIVRIKIGQQNVSTPPVRVKTTDAYAGPRSQTPSYRQRQSRPTHALSTGGRRSAAKRTKARSGCGCVACSMNPSPQLRVHPLLPIGIATT